MAKEPGKGKGIKRFHAKARTREAKITKFAPGRVNKRVIHFFNFDCKILKEHRKPTIIRLIEAGPPVTFAVRPFRRECSRMFALTDALAVAGSARPSTSSG